MPSCAPIRQRAEIGRCLRRRARSSRQRPPGAGSRDAGFRLWPLRRALPRLRRVRQGRPAVLPAATSPAARNVLDIGCGRGEFLEMMRDARRPGARHRPERRVRRHLPRTRAWKPRVADLFEYLAGQPEAALDGIFCSQVVEHLPPDRLPEMIRLARQPPLAQRRDRDRDAQPRMPGDLRHALLPGPDAPAPGPASAAGFLSGGIRSREYRSAAALAGGGIDAVAGSRCRRISGRRSSADWITRSSGGNCRNGGRSPACPSLFKSSCG